MGKNRSARFLGSKTLWAVLVLGGLGLGFGWQSRALDSQLLLPAFTHTTPAAWLNSPPLKVEALRGKVVLVEVWTSV